MSGASGSLVPLPNGHLLLLLRLICMILLLPPDMSSPLLQITSPRMTA